MPSYTWESCPYSYNTDRESCHRIHGNHATLFGIHAIIHMGIMPIFIQHCSGFMPTYTWESCPYSNNIVRDSCHHIHGNHAISHAITNRENGYHAHNSIVVRIMQMHLWVQFSYSQFSSIKRNNTSVIKIKRMYIYIIIAFQRQHRQHVAAVLGPGHQPVRWGALSWPYTNSIQ